MKTYLKIQAILVLVFSSVIFLNSCSVDPPVVTTGNISDITQTTAKSGGNVTDDGGADVTTRGICWDTSDNPTTMNSTTSDGTGTGSFSSSLTQLTPGTKYYVRAYATNEAGTGYGSSQSFTTGEILLATLTTAAVTSLTATSAVSGGNITSDGGGTINLKGVCWGSSPNPTIETLNITYDGYGDGSFTSNITDLSPSTTYHVRAYATNSAGTAYGDDRIFTTEGAKLPTLGVIKIISENSFSVEIEGIIIDNGGVSITEIVVEWDTNPSTFTNGFYVYNLKETGIFSDWIERLSPNTTYYVRANASNIIGKAYSDILSFTTPGIGAIVFNPDLTYGSVSDIDGNTYKTIQIGTQTWMAENLKTKKFNDGASISLVTDRTTWGYLTTPALCWWNNDEMTYKDVFGALYNWFAANNDKLCPTGWHVPSDSEWTTLVNYLGGSKSAGNKLRETGGVHWFLPLTNVNNESGFTALPGGSRVSVSDFWWEIGSYCRMWSSTEYSYDKGYYRTLNYINEDIFRSYTDKTGGQSVRCLKD